MCILASFIINSRIHHEIILLANIFKMVDFSEKLSKFVAKLIFTLF